MPEPILEIVNLSVSAGSKTLLRPITLNIPEGGVFGIIGPSGAGKSTFLKCVNRLVDLSPGLSVKGQLRYRGQDVLGPRVDPDALRSRIGMLFQQPVVFPCSIVANVLFGVRHLGRIPKSEWADLAELSLRQVALWNEVKDRLKKPGQLLSVGQQQRLCLARALATNPDLILMDEPTSALDPKSTEAIEELVLELARTRTILLVTHNLRQTQKICQKVAFIALRDGVGTLLETGSLSELRHRDGIPELEEYLCCELP